MTQEIKINAKWGFGMAPEKEKTLNLRKQAIREILHIGIEGDIAFEKLNVEHISELKGLFTRCVKQDQWDWFIVWWKLGGISRSLSRDISQLLANFRKAISNSNYRLSNEIYFKLVRKELVEILSNYLSENDDFEGGSIYILSTREQRNILKIGCTNRNPIDRVREINQSTGLLIPFGVRAAWRVQNPFSVEKQVHELLAEYRIRNDREFFQLDFRYAVEEIEQYLKNNDLYLMSHRRI